MRSIVEVALFCIKLTDQYPSLVVLFFVYPGYVYTHFSCCARTRDTLISGIHFSHTWDTLEKRRDTFARILTTALQMKDMQEKTEMKQAINKLNCGKRIVTCK